MRESGREVRLALTEEAGIHGGEDAVRVVRGDALDVSAALAAEKPGRARLVYLDPPFATQTDYVNEARLDGPADGRVRRNVAYGDKLDLPSYLEMLALRLEALARLLADDGTMWVHVDWRASYLVRALLDEILGRDRFLNEIVWRRAPNLGRQAASGQFGRTLDTLVVYGKSARARLVPPTRLEPIDDRAVRFDEQGRAFTSAPRGDYTDASVARLEAEGRIHRTKAGKVYVKYFLVKSEGGGWCRERRVDALWTDVAPLRHAQPRERTGFPTQKPRALLDRIVRCATDPGDLVVDLFCGSGTTAESAFSLGRRVVVGDVGATAIATTRARLLRAGAPLRLERVVAGEGGRERDGERDDMLTVRVKARRASAGEVDVRLLAPDEPLAWAIAAPFSASEGVFRTRWHAERQPGTRPIPAPSKARVRFEGGPVAVRVFGDDGAVGTAVVEP